MNKNFERTNIIVWLDGEEEWNRVYMCDGKLYIRIGAGKNDFAKLDDCDICKIDTL